MPLPGLPYAPDVFDSGIMLILRGLTSHRAGSQKHTGSTTQGVGSSKPGLPTIPRERAPNRRDQTAAPIGALNLYAASPI